MPVKIHFQPLDGMSGFAFEVDGCCHVVIDPALSVLAQCELVGSLLREGELAEILGVLAA